MKLQIKKQWRKIKERTAALVIRIGQAWGVDKASDVIMAIGLVLLGCGASRLHVGAGPVIVGLLLVLYIKPVAWFIKR